ncbi:cytochrome c biogenesis protein CcsA [Carboxylicivirga sp. A043]|uniref:cytochrome c biogenesis protein CcsA n=1 Tax=Carboxylicivirga litoralis TaxID=2816963 RepID=UPI0021CB2775|nr:cytochrome c biogenesis protein CcsA [Carboxylicivirga sp. A043]MCU4156503.1 cytochrome c biogenesis protein CcsA [Carboxylicivirga sp. A043]
MKKLFEFLTAYWLMGSLLLFLAAVLGVATFIENDFGTNASKALVYNAWWFELVFVLLTINMVGNLLKFKSFSTKKLPGLVFHLAFLIIIIGAAVTRYVGYEGMMHIREGATSNEILSSEQFVNASIKANDYSASDEESVLFSIVSPNEYSASFSTPKGTLKLRSDIYIPQAMSRTVEKPGGQPAINLVLSAASGRQEFTLFEGDEVQVGDYRVAFNPEKEDGQALILSIKDGMPHYKPSIEARMMQMQTGTSQTFAADSIHPLYNGVLYSVGDLRMVLTSYMESAGLEPVSVEGDQGRGLPDAIKFVAELGDKRKDFFVFGQKDVLGKAFVEEIDGVQFSVSYGSKIIQIPFSLKLNKFELERYPGSESPSSFASEVTLVDERTGLKEDRRIFMNNILNYHGYRFFQSSYDRDEKGTILSVNRDWWGTLLTYLGYFLLSLGMFAALVAPNTRFRQLIKRTSEIYKKKQTLTLLLVTLLSTSAWANELNPPHNISQESAEAFGQLWVQDNGGRMKPLNTMNSEVLRKLAKHHTFKGWSADKVVLSMMIDAAYWQTMPMITVKHDDLKGMLQISGKKASFKDFFTANGQYKIRKLVEDSYRKRPAYRNKLEQEAVKVDEQINVFYMSQMGSFLKLFPQPGNPQDSWLAPGAKPEGFSSEDSLLVRNLFGMYLEALSSGNTVEEATYLKAIGDYQKKYGNEILPSESKKKIEIFYNNSSLFMSLMPYFLVLGLILLFFQLTTLVNPKWQFKWIVKGAFILIVVAFAAYTLGLALRWYISGHAPWSNGYESMLYIGWSTLLAGLLFSKQSPIALSVSSFFTGIILMVAHLSWMNPEITNLVPVLKSYWLTIHVAIITASYGFLALGALLGFLNLILFGVKSPKNNKAFSLTIEELSSIAEMSMTIGLYFLTIGAFLGGVWANESWGRYWGWDPKETWSAVTILVYAFVLHMRFIPGMKGLTTFNFWSVISFSSVLMTYLGVNYYLAGMHSYAKGDPVPIPAFVYYTIVVVGVISFFAYYNETKVQKALAEEQKDE